VIYTSNARIDIPTTTTRLTPYFVAGGGAATERRTADFSYPWALPPTPGPVEVPFTTLRVASTSTDLAVTLGGGIGVRVLSQLSVDVDVRLFRLFGSKGYYPKDHNVGRFGVGVRYRF
jgi:opacity protein-like surface antigen